MITTSARRQQIASSLKDKEYRDLFVAEEIETSLPFQIREIRQAHGWSQKELAERAGMSQEAISRLESPDYGRYTLTTLRRLASAFDVALVVRFAPFSELVAWAAGLSPDDLAVPDYERDLGMHALISEANVAGTADLTPSLIRDTTGKIGNFVQKLPDLVIQLAQNSTGRYTFDHGLGPGSAR